MAKYSLKRKSRVVAAVIAGESSIRAAARAIGASETTVSEWVRRTRAGEPLELKRGRRPMKYVLGPQEMAHVEDWVTADPHLGTEEIRTRLIEHAGRRVSRTTLWQAMKRHGIGQESPIRFEDEQGDTPSPTRYKDIHRREPGPGRYPSSLTDAEWAVLEPLVTTLSPSRGRPRVHPPRVMMDAIFYVLRSGCSWRMLPADFPKWQAVYAVFRCWSMRGTMEEIYRTLYAMWREREGRAATPSGAIIDSQSVKTTEKGGLAATMVARGSTVESDIFS